MTRVLVIGGGITGLAAGHRLAGAGVPVTLVEGSDWLGGKIRTERADGFVIEHGPDSFLTGRPAFLELCQELGLSAELVPPIEPRTAFVWHDSQLVPLPEGTAMGIPSHLGPFVASPLFSPIEKLRMGLDLVLPAAATDADESVGRLLRRRMGDALVDRLAAPLIGAIFGTSIDELSLLATMPHLREAERRHRSLILAMRSASLGNGSLAKGGSGGSGPPAPRRPSAPFLSLVRGMGSLVEALVAALPSVDIRTGVAALSLERNGGSFVARCTDGRSIEADGVVLATDAPVSSGLLSSVAPPLAFGLREIRYGSTVVVSLGYRAADLPRPLAGHGFVVGARGGLAIAACTQTSAKWLGRAPEGTVLFRVSLGGAFAEPGPLGNEFLVTRASADMRSVLGIRGAPIVARVAHWSNRMPRHTVGHLDRIAAMEAEIARIRGLHLAGAAYRGAGVSECVAQGRAAADRILSDLGSQAG